MKLIAVAILALTSLAAAAPTYARSVCAGALVPREGYGRAPWNEIDFDAVEKELATGEVVEKVPLGEYFRRLGRKVWFSTDAYVIRYRSGILGVFKVGPAWTLETGAYRAARDLGNAYVPPVVPRELDGKLGSVQYFVQFGTPRDTEESDDPLLMVSPEARSEIQVFQFVFGYWDRHQGNLIIDPFAVPAQIDFEDLRIPSQVSYGDREFIFAFPIREGLRRPAEAWPAAFPFGDAVLMRRPDRETFLFALSPFSSAENLENIWNRISRRQDTTFRYVVWRNRFWIQKIGFAKYPAIRFELLSRRVLDAYRAIDLPWLRAHFPTLGDELLRFDLERRDELLRIARDVLSVP